MKLSERSIRIKELISGQLDMGTFGLVELELIEFDKELHELKKLRVADVSGRSELLVCTFCGSSKLDDCGDGSYGCGECGHYPVTN